MVFHAISLGFIAGLTCLGRIDFGIVFLVFLAISFLIRKLNFMWCVISGVTMLFVVSPWFVWVHSVCGKWLPSSGEAQAGLINGSNALSRIWVVTGSIINHATPWIYLPAFGQSRLVDIIAIISIIGFLTWIGKNKLVEVCNIFSKWPISGWVAGFIALIVVYPVFLRLPIFIIDILPRL